MQNSRLNPCSSIFSRKRASNRPFWCVRCACMACHVHKKLIVLLKGEESIMAKNRSSGEAVSSPELANEFESPLKGGKTAKNTADGRYSEAIEESGRRALYVLAERDRDPLNPPVFESGGDVRGGIAVFTGLNPALFFLQVA